MAQVQTHATGQSAIALHKEAFIHRAEDAAHYIGAIDLNKIQTSMENSFERFAIKQVDKFKAFNESCNNLITTVLTAHPTFFYSKEAAALQAKLVEAYASGQDAQDLEAQIEATLKAHPYKDPTTDQEGDLLYEAFKNTLSASEMMQRAQIKIAQKYFPDQWKTGVYSAHGRASWQKADRDGRVIPMHVHLGEALRQRRMGLEFVHLPKLQTLLEHPTFLDNNRTKIENVIQSTQDTINFYRKQEDALSRLNADDTPYLEYLKSLDSIMGDIQNSDIKRITHPDHITNALKDFLRDLRTPDDLYLEIKLIVDNLNSNGICLAALTHRVGAQEGYDYLDVERQKIDLGALQNTDELQADELHFAQIEDMITTVKTVAETSLVEALGNVPKDGRSLRELMLIKRFTFKHVDSHTTEKLDVAESHNATALMTIEHAMTQYGTRKGFNPGMLHEDQLGIDPAYTFYKTLLKSKPYLKGILDFDERTTKKKPCIYLKIGFSDYAKQHGSTSGKPSNEKCLLDIMRAIRDAGPTEAIDLDIEFAGGEGAGRRKNPSAYKAMLDETITSTVLAYANKLGINLKYRDTVQGGDGCIFLGTPALAAKAIATQLDHVSKGLTQDPTPILQQNYYIKTEKGGIQEHVKAHHRTAKETYHNLYNHPGFSLLMNLHKPLSIKGGSRKLNRGELVNPYDAAANNKAAMAGFRAIGFNVTTMLTGVHLPPGYGQGTAFFQQTPKVREKLSKSPLFRKRLTTAFMVRDLHMEDSLKNFIARYNPDYWRGFDRLTADGQDSVEFKLSNRMQNLVYSDGGNRCVYSRLSEIYRVITDDLHELDRMRGEYDFSDVEKTIAQGDYTERLAQKRQILDALHANRLQLLEDYFKALESTDVYSPDYEASARETGIKAGLCLDFDIVSKVFGDRFKSVQAEAKQYAMPIVDLCYQA